MKIKKFADSNKTIFIFIFFLILINLFNFIQVKASSDFDFSINVDINELIIKAGETKKINVLINSTNYISNKVNLSGNWIEDNQPNGVMVNLDSQSEITPLFTHLRFSTTNQSEIGHFIYNISANLDEKVQFINIKVTIINNITIAIKADKEVFQKGEKIHVFGNISQTHQKNNIDDINITYRYNKWKRFDSAKIKNNSFDFYYNISYGDPDGIWNLTTTIIDNEENVFSNDTKINVVPPPDILRFNVLLYSPPEDAVYYRGNIVDISVYVTEAGIGVNNAITSCIFSMNNRVNLTEIADGYYQGSYRIPWDSEIGFWSISIECIKQSGSSLKAGGSYTFVEVKPATISLELLKPTKNEYNIDESFSIIANLSYPDGKIVKDAEVIAKTPSSNIELVDQQNGTYLIKYMISNDDLGSWFMDVYANDKYGNNAFTSKTIQINEIEKLNIPLSNILGILFISLIGFLAAYFFRRNFSVQRLNDIEEEIQEEEQIQNETVVKYFKTGSISRNTYDALMKQHTQRLGELNKEKSKIKKIKWRKN